MKTTTVVLRTPGQNSMKNAGVGFVDTVTTEDGEVRPVIHMVPESPLNKGCTVMVFPGRGRELPLNITNHTQPGTKQPGYVVYQQDKPVGSGWLHIGKKAYLVVKINKELAQDDERLTIFPRFVREAA